MLLWVYMWLLWVPYTPVPCCYGCMWLLWVPYTPHAVLLWVHVVTMGTLYTTHLVAIGTCGYYGYPIHHISCCYGCMWLLWIPYTPYSLLLWVHVVTMGTLYTTCCVVMGACGYYGYPIHHIACCYGYTCGYYGYPIHHIPCCYGYMWLLWVPLASIW